MSDALQGRLAAALGSQYQIESELPAGGMSRVFLARDTALDRRVVIKVLAPDRAGVLSTERFRKEALLAASLQHPHIVPILAAGAVDDVPYLVMPFVAGLSLRQRLESTGALPLRDAVRILLDVARACAYAHEHGIVHRDIKPDNVLMSGDAAMITDFGVARAVAAGGAGPQDSRLTQEGFTVGSPRYMAPEQAAGDPDIDHRADIYAFGVLAFELVAGAPPFDFPSSALGRRAHLTTLPPDLRSVRPDAPVALARLIDWCLAKRREDRPQHASEVVAALEDPGVVSSSHARQIVTLGDRPSRVLFIAAAAALVLAAAVGWWRFGSTASVHRLDSIAVLPVIDRTSDSTSAWMASGLTDEVTAVLGRVAGVRVAARRTVERFRSDTASPQRIAATLHVATVLDATLTRVDSSHFQLAAQLIDGGTGLVIWSASLRGGNGDVLALQDSVVNGVLHAIGRARDSVPAAAGLEDPAARRTAWAEYLRGRQELRRRGTIHLREAISHFAAALRDDAMLPQAYTGLADAWSLLPLYDPGAGRQPLARALDAVDHALALDPTLPQARASRGHLLAGIWQWKEAEADLRAALAADPALIDARQWLGELLLVTGRTGEATKVLTDARALDPTSAVVVAIQGFGLGVGGHFADGMAAINAALQLDPSFAEACLFAGAVQLLAREPAGAASFLDRGLALAPGDPLLIGLRGQAAAVAGDTARVRQMMAQLDALPPGVATHGGRAHIQLGMGNLAAALASLDQAVSDHEPIFAAEPLGTALFAPIRGSAQFAALLARIGFDSAASRAIRGIR